MEKTQMQEFEEATKDVESGEAHVRYNFEEFVKHFDKYYLQLSNAIEDMRAEVSLLRGDTEFLIEQITRDVEEGEVCEKCGKSLI